MMLSWSLIQLSDHDCLHTLCMLLISSHCCLIHNYQSSWYLSCCIEVSQLSLKQLLLIQLLSIQLRRVSVGSLLPNGSCDNCTTLRSLEYLWKTELEVHRHTDLDFAGDAKVNRQIHVDRRCVNLLEQWEQMIVAWSCLVTIITW